MVDLFTSDMHFWHKNIFKYCPKTRLGKSVQEMNNIMIKNWCEQASGQDRVFHMGDFSFNKDHMETIRLVESLPGKKVFIRGNHDYSRFWRELAKLPNVEVHEYLELVINGTRVVMFHYPIKEWNQMQHGAYHLFGHVHGRTSVATGRSMDVGIDARPLGDMKLWTWREINNKLSKLEVLHHGDGVE